MKEVSPKKLQKLNDKSFKNIQKLFRRRLREIAAGGRNEADFDKGHFVHEKRVVDWLQGLGFMVKEGTNKYYITWPEKDALEEFCSEAFKIFTRPMSARVFGVAKLKHLDEEREWRFDPHLYDYVCSGCGKHSEYKTPYCPNCGAKMKEEKENK